MRPKCQLRPRGTNKPRRLPGSVHSTSPRVDRQALEGLAEGGQRQGGAAEQGGGDAKLLKMVVLSRHGVRSPTQSSETLESWSRKDWPEWPVKRGELTPRGAKLVTAMWEQEAAF